MRLYGGVPPYAVGHFLAKALLSVSSFSYLLDESLIWPSSLDTCSHSKIMPLRRHSPPVVLSGAPGAVLSTTRVFRTHPRAATPRRCPQLRAAAALSPLLFAGVATYMAPLRESPPLS